MQALWVNRIYELEAENARLRAKLETVRLKYDDFMRYRSRNTLNFQLEKADDYFRAIGILLEDDEK